MSEFPTTPRPEVQHIDNNNLLASKAKSLLPTIRREYEDDYATAAAEYRLSDGTSLHIDTYDYFAETKANQPLFLKITHPFVEGSREIEEYDLLPHGENDYHIRSSLFAESQRSQGEIAAVAGHAALRQALLNRPLFQLRLSKRRERKVLERAMQIEMNADRTNRIYGLLEKCNTTNRI